MLIPKCVLSAAQRHLNEIYENDHFYGCCSWKCTSVIYRFKWITDLL